MTFDVRILNDNNDEYDKRQLLEKTGNEKRKREEKDRHLERERKIIKSIDKAKSSHKEKVKQNKNIQLEERAKEKWKGKDKDRYIAKGGNEKKFIESERHTAQEVRVNGKSRVEEMESPEKRITKAVHLECVYQYPETSQMEVLLSDMMNQLTRLIVSAHEYSEGDVGRVGIMGDAHEVNNPTRSGKRFRVVNDRSPAVFETIFKQLTDEYQKFYNTTLQKIDRSKDPCDHQTEVKYIWQDLLAQSQLMLHRSTLLAAEQISPRNRADGSKHDKMKRMLGAELAKIRSEQLDTLCDNFQLCYNELL
ncbi:uncharacterized protein LOC123868456 [Maniola jurtina]|uniref:uncharacterized protein LOC123868456 n=1 Tax=Maniola jurtina TaxID=191418 RepID=UPI001E689CFB|nr:uncharacterized protein LOC123868456 [Maniola jurtina]